MIPTIITLSSERPIVVAADYDQHRVRYPWMRFVLWLLIISATVALATSAMPVVPLHDWVCSALAGLLATGGACVVAWDIQCWQRRCLVAQTVRTIRRRRCVRRTIVVCPDPALIGPLARAMFALVGQRTHSAHQTVLVCRTAAELNPLLHIRPCRRVIVITTHVAWSSIQGGKL